MSRTLTTRLLSLVPALLAAVLLLGTGRPAAANITCFQDLRDCYLKAAGRADWASRSLAGADCELAFIDCTRRAIFGR
ncbi:MAG: hypothetical protein ACM3SQ_19315 [Betaproteobacteria bacterium]